MRVNLMYAIGSQTEKQFEKFFKEYFPPVYLFLKHYTQDSELAADLAQETFTRVFEQRDKVPIEKCSKAYLYTIARHLYWHHCRHKNVEENYLSKQLEDEDDYYDFLQEVTLRETLQILHKAINHLPPRTQQIIRLNLAGKSNTEAAEYLQISLNTVKDLKKTAYVTLRKILSKDYFIFLLWMIEK